MRAGRSRALILLFAVALLTAASAGCVDMIAAMLTPSHHTIKAKVPLSGRRSLAIAPFLIENSRRSDEAKALTLLVKRQLDANTHAEISLANEKAAGLAARGRIADAAAEAGTDFFLAARVKKLESSPPGSIGFMRGMIEVEVDVYDNRAAGVAYSGTVRNRHPKKPDAIASDMTDEQMIQRLLGLSAGEIGRLFYNYKITHAEFLERGFQGTQ